VPEARVLGRELLLSQSRYGGISVSVAQRLKELELEPGERRSDAMSSAVVVFVDLLGFASLTEQCVLAPEAFDVYKPRQPTNYQAISNEYEPPENALIDTYVRFHQALEQSHGKSEEGQANCHSLLRLSIHRSGPFA